MSKKFKKPIELGGLTPNKNLVMIGPERTDTTLMASPYGISLIIYERDRRTESIIDHYLDQDYGKMRCWIRFQSPSYMHSLARSLDAWATNWEKAGGPNDDLESILFDK